MISHAYLRLIAAFGALPLAVAGAAQAQEGGQSLDQAASDPTAAVTSIMIADWWSYDYHGLDDGEDNTIYVRAAIPFKVGSRGNIFRVSVPIITDHPALDSGVGDATIFDLMVYERPWGRFGVGAVALIPTGGSTRGADQWAVGPAIGFTAQAGDGWMVGAFNQNLFHVAGDQDRGQADVNISQIQPILVKSLGGGWSVGTSEMQFVYDWEDSRFSSLPVGVQLTKLQTFGTTPVQLSVQYEHNLADDAVTASDTLRFSAKVILR